MNSQPLSASPVSRPPNVVFILADDLGWRDTSLYGSTFYETPNIDRLAARGMLFTQAYAANPLCSPTRASIMTGLIPSRIGITQAAGHLPEGEHIEDRLEGGIGETNDLARERPEMVKELSPLIDCFLRETQAVIPRPNPAYDPQAAPPTVSQE
ncbi:MAG: sulfatase-like hydrolase/transferase [Chloroflexi bacterium]|nr:sulfatase-like hydrolase/transferase [Chloroflexota bacterium]